MADVKLYWKEWGADAAIQGGDLGKDDSLETAVILSLFLDARARDDDVLPDEAHGDRRGWWADSVVPAAERDRTGSRLWLLGREKVLPEVLRRARDYAVEALQWLIDDGIASAVDVRAFVPGHESTIGRKDMLALDIRITRTGGEIAAYRFNLPSKG